MKFDFVKKWKISLISFIAVVLVGMILLGVFGFNNPVYVNKQTGPVILAVALALVAIFLVVLCVDKFKGAVTVFATALASALLFVAIMNIARIPARPFLAVSLSISALLGATLSSVIVARYKELQKIYTDLSVVEVANKGVLDSLLRILFVVGSLVVLSVLVMALLGLVFVGLQIALSSVVASAVALFIAPIVWAVLNDRKALEK